MRAQLLLVDVIVGSEVVSTHVIGKYSVSPENKPERITSTLLHRVVDSATKAFKKLRMCINSLITIEGHSYRGGRRNPNRFIPVLARQIVSAPLQPESGDRAEGEAHALLNGDEHIVRVAPGVSADIADGSHDSPSVSGSAAGTVDAPIGTVGEPSTGTTTSPSGVSVDPTGNAA